MDLSPLFISIKTAVLATVITFFLGLYAARYVINLERYQGIIDGVFTLPLVLPPTVVGFFLLILLGKNSWIGSFLAQFDLSVVFSWEATVIASTVVAFPLMYRTARGAFEQIDHNLISAARTLGMSEEKIFWRVILPLSWSGIAAGTVLAFARALGEFGATIMLAGNIPGRTQTMATAIYSAVQAGDRDTAYVWAVVIIIISFVIMILMNYWSNIQKRVQAAGKMK
ncbi:molybdate ABC transporter permease subunit [Anaerosinus massiliensis]|uniref:molybdate ABC transporter permease subunit n=1 Tax=Massilibacillus massiliensis TaxID=1806837 RepID=UPI000AD8C901|nr:molybdate ABC transporter permease subunit [Massilibacillus massiliensis]